MQNQPNNTALSPFAFQGQAVRVQADDHGNPWFCAKDVCAILGYANHSDTVKKVCRAKGVSNSYPLQTSGGIQYPTFITEGNVFRLILKSNKPEAEPFESWVCDEVIPSLRKTGAYHPQPHEQPIVPEGTQQLMDTLFAAAIPDGWAANAALCAEPPQPETITLSKDCYITLLETLQELNEALRRSKQKRKPWTSADEARLRARHAEGLSTAEIAKLLGRSVQSVETRLYYLKIKVAA